MVKVAYILLFALLTLAARPAIATCSAEGNECLLRMSLEQVYQREACEAREKHLKAAEHSAEELAAANERRAVKAEKAVTSPAWWVVGGVLLGIGLSSLVLIAGR